MTGSRKPGNKRHMDAERNEQYYRYQSYEGNEAYVTLPERMEGRLLTAIGAKAFLSCRTVERLELPDTLVQVEDWAFAHMKNLKELVLPPREIHFGKKVFLGCDSLERIFLRGARGQYEGIPLFLASQVRWMEGMPVNLDLAGAKQGQWQWLEAYDRALLGFLSESDDVGFEPAFIGWFYVEDVDSQRETYMLERQKCKVRLALQRLRYPERVSRDTRGQLGDYLRGPLFLELCGEQEYARDVEYFRIWQQIGGFSLYSPQFLLEQMPGADPEVRGFLMKCSLSREQSDDFFKKMEL